jgi:DNA-directed RNA polymerase specialized sigma24 family protein
MGFDKRYEGIDEYAVRIIKYKARQLVGRVGFTESDREDLEQEMLMDLLQRLPKYNPDRAQRNTFIARVVEHKIATIIEARKAGLRDYRLCRCSLNDQFESGEYEDSFCIERMETIDQDVNAGRKVRHPPRRSKSAAPLAAAGRWDRFRRVFALTDLVSGSWRHGGVHSYGTMGRNSTPCPAGGREQAPNHA